MWDIWPHPHTNQHCSAKKFMSPDELNTLVAQGETPSFELKAGVPRPDIVARVLGSFANTEGGTIAFGIQEPRRIVGADANRVRKVIESASQMLTPKQDVQIEDIELDGKSVVVAHVQRSSSLVAAGGAYYTRRGDATQAISAQEIRAHLAEVAPEVDPAKELAEAVAKQTATIEKLTEDFAKTNSIKRKIGIGAIGAIIGAVSKAVIEGLLGG